MSILLCIQYALAAALGLLGLWLTASNLIEGCQGVIELLHEWEVLGRGDKK
jgi:hypothetical protein